MNNNWQQMLKQAQKAQKNHENFKKEVFTFPYHEGLIKISCSGAYEIKLDINFKSMLEKLDNDYEMLNDIVQVSINESISEVKKKETKIISTI